MPGVLGEGRARSLRLDDHAGEVDLQTGERLVFTEHVLGRVLICLTLVLLVVRIESVGGEDEPLDVDRSHVVVELDHLTVLATQDHVVVRGFEDLELDDEVDVAGATINVLHVRDANAELPSRPNGMLVGIVKDVWQAIAACLGIAYCGPFTHDVFSFSLSLSSSLTLLLVQTGSITSKPAKRSFWGVLVVS